MGNLHLVTGHAGHEHITAADQGSFNIATVGSGSFVLNKGKMFEASYVSANTIRIKDGDLIMQGRHIRIKENDSEDVTLANGTNGKNRIDLITVRYTKDESTAIESAAIHVIQGNETTGSPVAPDYVDDDITENGNALVCDFPLYKVTINSFSMQTPVAMFTVNKCINDVVEYMNEINDDLGDLGITVSGIQESMSDFDSKNFVLCKNQVLTFTNNVCTITDAKITSDSLADVYFTADSILVAEKADIAIETNNGNLTLTATRTPTGTISATILIKVV